MSESNLPPVPEGKSYNGLYPMLGLKVVKDFERPPRELVQAFGDRFIPDIADLVGVLYCVDYNIRPAYQPMPRLLGTALTIRVPPGDNMMVKKAMFVAKPGDVLVVDARGHTDWCLGGGGMTVVMKQLGIAGMLIDGAYRDIDQVQAIEFPMFLKGVAPATGPKIGPGMINVPVHCGGVIINPGDIIVGDNEGVVVVPREAAAAIAAVVKGKELHSKPEDWGDFNNVVARQRPWVDYIDQVLTARGCEFVEFAD